MNPEKTDEKMCKAEFSLWLCVSNNATVTAKGAQRTIPTNL